MPDIRSLSTGMQVALGASILLLIDMFLDWQSVDVGPFDVGQNAWNGFWGVVLGLLTIVFLAWLLARLFSVNLPELPVPWRTIALALGGLILLFALIKNLADEYSTIWSYIGVILAAGCAVGAWLLSQEPELAPSVPDTPEVARPSATTTAPPPEAPPPAAPSTTPQPPAAGTTTPPSSTTPPPSDTA